MSDCIFCKIIKGEIPSKKIYEDEDLFAFHDIAPGAPVHFLVVPKRHIENIMETEEADSELVGRLLTRGALIAKQLGCGERGGRFVINCKSDGAQTVNHLHLHVLGGRPLAWPPG